MTDTAHGHSAIGLGHSHMAPDHDRGRSLAKKSSKWGEPNRHGLPETLNLDALTSDQIALFSVHVRIDEIGRLLRTPADYIPATPDRSPSPEPFYGADGKRVNTREFRYRKRLEDERHKLVAMATAIDPKYHPPTEYRRPTKLQEKIYIPVREFPSINFIGLLLGPRGSTLKQMEADSGAKIAIRGKGSVKEGKGAPTSYQNQEEDLHCVITGETEAKVKAGCDMVNRIIETASTVPEAQNELKRQQLRDLAALNGTLRDDENQVCQNCGALGHKRYQCPERSNFTNTVICRICGNAGHFARDCMMRNNPEAMAEVKQRETQMDQEYAQLMAQLGAGGAPADGGAGGDGTGDRDAGGAAPWAAAGGARSGGGGGGGGGLRFGGSDDAGGADAGGPAPWARGGGEGHFHHRDREHRDRYDARHGADYHRGAPGGDHYDGNGAAADGGSIPPWAAGGGSAAPASAPAATPAAAAAAPAQDLTAAAYAAFTATYGHDPAYLAMAPEVQQTYWQQFYYAYYAQHAQGGQPQ
ncbi:hypothetical protein BCR44DRAFT_48185 [Catenaria anguillulae PL171]|uniref:Branchpoint-bridging protein n=1 Tax=Catenaria anguillulae PL171 TaxID=765915 RepID=A0A1Y2HW41_9FUNG|nr:hypothetical protein BCR44DRAFT_48185 [Catenaria anguillulae PL171]